MHHFGATDTGLIGFKLAEVIQITSLQHSYVDGGPWSYLLNVIRLQQL